MLKSLRKLFRRPPAELEFAPYKPQFVADFWRLFFFGGFVGFSIVLNIRHR